MNTQLVKKSAEQIAAEATIEVTHIVAAYAMRNGTHEYNMSWHNGTYVFHVTVDGVKLWADDLEVKVAIKAVEEYEELRNQQIERLWEQSYQTLASALLAEAGFPDSLRAVTFHNYGGYLNAGKGIRVEVCSWSEANAAVFYDTSTRKILAITVRGEMVEAFCSGYGLAGSSGIREWIVGQPVGPIPETVPPTRSHEESQDESPRIFKGYLTLDDEGF
jgi:hypothetical protein